ncbi:phage tail assembly protein [Aeromonas salmonicida]|uniref:phage tail assembly protein n=1 Tax=Aeromonas salmonicida TaxID=645 RepID=UPI0031D4BB52
MSVPYIRTHPLRWPITDDKDNPLGKITLHTIPLSQSLEIKAPTPPGVSEEVRLVVHNEAWLMAMSGLTAGELEQLAFPDYNSLMAMMFALSSRQADELRKHDQGDQYQAGDPDQPLLLVPVKDPFLGEVTHARLRPPTVRMTRLADTFSGMEREIKLVAAVTELDETTVRSLHMPDWHQLQGRVADFLEQGADFFPQVTSNG